MWPSGSASTFEHTALFHVTPVENQTFLGTVDEYLDEKKTEELIKPAKLCSRGDQHYFPWEITEKQLP